MIEELPLHLLKFTYITTRFKCQIRYLCVSIGISKISLLAHCYFFMIWNAASKLNIWWIRWYIKIVFIVPITVSPTWTPDIISISISFGTQYLVTLTPSKNANNLACGKNPLPSKATFLDLIVGTMRAYCPVTKRCLIELLSITCLGHLLIVPVLNVSQCILVRGCGCFLNDYEIPITSSRSFCISFLNFFYLLFLFFGIDSTLCSCSSPICLPTTPNYGC